MRDPTLDGFYQDGTTIHARLDGEEMQFDPHPQGERAVLAGKGFRIEVSLFPLEVLAVSATRSVELDTATLWRIVTAWESIFGASTGNVVRPKPVRP